MKNKIYFLLIGLIIIGSCCPFIKEEHLGNHIYLSEFDNADIRILYSEERCSRSGIELVPMTILEYAYNSKWIIVKSGTKGHKYLQYWIINKDFKIESDFDYDNKLKIIKSHLICVVDSSEFADKLKKLKIDLIFKKI